MRSRSRIIANLEDAYRESYERAHEAGDEDEMTRLSFGFLRDQLFMEAVLDVRDLLTRRGSEGEPGSGTGRTEEKEGQDAEEEFSLLEKARALRRITRLR